MRREGVADGEGEGMGEGMLQFRNLGRIMTTSSGMDLLSAGIGLAIVTFGEGRANRGQVGLGFNGERAPLIMLEWTWK